MNASGSKKPLKMTMMVTKHPADVDSVCGPNMCSSANSPRSMAAALDACEATGDDGMECTRFCSGSSYMGSRDHMGFAGSGVYRYPDGMIYEGEMHNGHFHGSGQLIHPSGHVLRGNWLNGECKSYRNLTFSDGLRYKKHNWKYCSPDDRRFRKEMDEIPGIGNHNLAASIRTRSIPKGCYDTGEGFYSPQTKCLYDPLDLNRVLRIPTSVEEKWIIEHCRKAWRETVGPRPGVLEEVMDRGDLSILSADTLMSDYKKS